MTKTDCHRTALACVARGHPRWLLLPLEMLSTCTCYSRLHWKWFEYVSPCYWTTWSYLVLARFRFLMKHVLGPYCSICQFSIGTRVVLRLGHVSFLHWTMCRIFIGPHGRFLFDHVSRYVLVFDSATWLNDFLPRVRFLLAHMSCHGYFTCHALVRPCVVFLFDHVACPGSTTCPTINSSNK
jgi:hypothetical protein